VLAGEAPILNRDIVISRRIVNRGSRLRRAYLKLYGWASERLYHELAWAYEGVAWSVSFGQWGAWRRQALTHAAGERLLEIGFGTGRLLAAAVAMGYTVTGIDLSSEMHAVAGRFLTRQGLMVSTLRARVQMLPFADGVFDTVVATFPTNFIFDSDVLREVVRVLSPDVDGQPGRFVITGLGVRSQHRIVRRLYGSLFGGATEDGVAWFARRTEALGFEVTVVDDGAGLLRMPVLILRPTADLCDGVKAR
jgi:SAM-dependent methyltransferase